MKRSARAADPDGGGAAASSARAADADRGSTAKKRARAAETAVPGPSDGRKIARVFMSGRSQAVRLPKEFRFDTDRVIIRREGRHVVLSPMFKDWEDYFENSTPLPDDFEVIMAEMREEELPLEEREPFD
jgi:antitoxin VapB